MKRLHFIDFLAVVSGGSTITAWQEQLEWWLKIIATLVAIAAGIASLLYHRRVRRTEAGDVMPVRPPPRSFDPERLG
jgi:membrane protein DedA with SNARE-associated domain